MFDFNNLEQTRLTLFLIILAVSIGLLFLTRRLLKISFPYFFMGLLGLIIGLVIGSLVAGPLAKLPGQYGIWVPMIVDVFITVAVLDLFIAQARPASVFFHRITERTLGKEENFGGYQIIVDTSSLIDGRIEQVAQSGFLMGEILIPGFILEELQKVADADDPIRRAKGRRGLESLDRMQHNPKLNLEIVDDLENRSEER